MYQHRACNAKALCLYGDLPLFWTEKIVGSFLWFCFKVCLVISRESERVHAQVGEGQRETERENPKQALSYQHGTQWGARSRGQ